MKRSSQVALLLMGVTSAGASGYALLPPRGCAATEKPAAMAPGAINPQALAPGTTLDAKATVPCDTSRRSSWGYRSYWSSRSYAYGSSGTQPSARRSLFSPSTSHTSVPSVGSRSAGSRDGFGGTGHSVGAHSSGG
jgi:hypothetical protein